MAEFLIKLADERGHVSEQLEAGASELEVRDRFTQQGYLVYWVRPRGLLGGGGELRWAQRRKVNLEQFIIFNQQFVTLVRAGLPILNALDLLIKQQKSDFFRNVLQNVRDRVKSGELLSDAFAAQGVFPKIYTTTLLAGEKSGNLEEVLTRYINFQRMTLAFRKKVLTAMIYPAVLVVLIVVMLSFLMTYVVPEFANLYSQISTSSQLPGITQFMLAAGVVTRKYFPFGIAGLVLAIVLFLHWRSSESGAAAMDRARLRVPMLGGIWLKYQIAMFSRMLSTLLAGGIPLVPALETAGASMRSRYVAQGVIQAAARVREGRPLARSLEETKVFPELAIEMIEVGESTGALPVMLTSVAEFYEDDVQTAQTAMMSLIEPAILIIMGGVVGFVLISLYLPIFTLGAGGVR
jgi:type IV pilus assembly protein PilC